VLAESEREKGDVKTSIGRLAEVDVPFLISYITHAQAVTRALRLERGVMERFDKAMADKDEATIAQLAKEVMEAGGQVEKALKDLDQWEKLYA